MGIGYTLFMFLILEYTALGIVFLIQKNYMMALYWLGATLLNVAVLKGMK